MQNWAPQPHVLGVQGLHPPTGTLLLPGTLQDGQVGADLSVTASAPGRVRMRTTTYQAMPSRHGSDACRRTR
jgi:hypothetical protein